MNLIASVLHLDRQAVQALRITDPYSLHRVVYGLYPDVRDAAAKAASQSSGILWADQGGNLAGKDVQIKFVQGADAAKFHGQAAHAQNRFRTHAALSFHSFLW